MWVRRRSFRKWKSAPPAIQDGKIVFTAPDADSVHCISLRDGKPIWKRAQIKGDLYMAGVYQGRVLIVGETQVRILDLKTGSQIWSASTTGDIPSGQGVASKGVYYLPLEEEAKSWPSTSPRAKSRPTTALRRRRPRRAISSSTTAWS